MPSVETARLLFRMFHPDDLDDLALMLADPDVMRYVGKGLPITREECEIVLDSIARHWDEHGFGRWAIIDKEAKAFAGYGGLRSMMGTPEVVYHLAKPFWGRGLATEIARASLRYGFDEHHFDSIIAVAKPENKASIRVMQKVGMQYEMHTAYYNIDVIQYRMLREEFNPGDAPFAVHHEVLAGA